ncbi:glycosyltransferase [Porifericola rhodea]|uniref:glycosyltransferase n=1 Tax=Porifericola rhodea TaxID=930972 RepID=UPI002666B78F|nr:glycosyltransferase [Porifericola rhodea]WKN29777.1 glycosyltransferase [Porifericola rhodea]
MKTVLFIILPYPSHYNACFGLAPEFKKRAYRVVFTGYPHLQNHVEQQGFEFCRLNYTTEYSIKTVKSFVSHLFLAMLDRRAVIKRYRFWYRSVIEIRKVYMEYRPEKIFIDAHLSHYYLYLYAYRQSVTILSTKLSTKKTPNIPPINSFYIPKDTALSRLICALLWKRHIIKIEIRWWINKVAFLGRDEAYFQKRLCKKYDLLWKEVFEKKNIAFIGLKNVPTIILGTEALEFPQRKKLPYERYISFPIKRNEEKYFSEEYRLTRERIIALKLQSNCQVIYCSFGTLSSLHLKKVALFIKKLIDVVEPHDDLALVISTSNLNSSFLVNSHHIFVFKQVPQLDILQYSDMMITHGGHNSIKECLQAGVPMLVYPLNKKVDQPGNAVRVFVNGHGLFGKIDKDKPEVILGKINRIFSIKEKMRQKCRSDESIQLL